MDPDETLRLLRLTIKQMRVDTDPAIRKAHADEIAEYFEALDEWLTKGGFPPKDWVKVRVEGAPLQRIVGVEETNAGRIYPGDVILLSGVKKMVVIALWKTDNLVQFFDQAVTSQAEPFLTCKPEDVVLTVSRKRI